MTDTTLLHSHSHEEGIGEFLHHSLEALGLSHEWTEFISHIVIDCVEIVSLLLIVMTAVFFLQSYIDFDRLKSKLTQLRSFWGYGLAVILGMLSPFCSCSIIPVMIGLLTMGVPLSVCLCMLTSASLLNLTALMGISSMLGQFTLLYLAGSILLIAGSSALMSRVTFHPEDLSVVEKTHDHCCDGCCHDEIPGYSQEMSILQRLRGAFENAISVLGSSWFFILLGVGISAALSSFFQMESIIHFVDENSFVSITVAALVGFPIHSDLFSALPILNLLLDISTATALSFSLATMSISIPSLVLLSRILRPKILLLYALSLLLLSIGIGWLLLLL